MPVSEEAKRFELSSLVEIAIRDDSHLEDSGGSLQKIIGGAPEDGKAKYYQELSEAASKRASQLASQLASSLQLASAMKLVATLKELPSLGSTRPLNSRTRSLLKIIETALPDEERRILRDKLKSYSGEDSKRGSRERQTRRNSIPEVNLYDLVPVELRVDLRRAAQQMISEGGEGVANTMRRDEVRRELTRLRRDEKILKLLSLTSTTSPDTAELFPLIDSISTSVKGKAFVQDLEVLKDKLGGKEVQQVVSSNLMLIFSDDPALGWSAGKYPLGNGSCQEYALGTMAEALMGYVGDGHTRIAYVVDANKIGARSPEELLSMPAQTILDGVVARTVVKIAETSAGDKVAVLEPTYTTINKANKIYNRAIEDAIQRLLPEDIKIYRTSSHGEELTIPASRNPEGQYEDGSEGGANHGGLGIMYGSYRLTAAPLAAGPER